MNRDQNQTHFTCTVLSMCQHPAKLLSSILLLALSAGVLGSQETAQIAPAEIDRMAAKVESQVVAWRRDIHQHPELGNREVRTSGLVAEHLRKLGLDVTTNVAHTGVVGLLRGGHPGPVVALRADMDALPVEEAVDLPFSSKVKAQYNGQEVSVMHACGHDAHTAILMGTAEVLSSVRKQLRGTVKFIFQPAEDSKPEGEEGGAELMIKEGVLQNPAPKAIFGLHVVPYPSGVIGYRSGGIMAGVDNFRILVHGRGTHGGMPWYGVDPVPVAAQIVLGLQTVVSRQIDLTTAPAVVTIGMIRGGTQPNIVPGEVELSGTVRSLDPKMRTEIRKRIESTATGIAQASGAKSEVSFPSAGAPITFNDAALLERVRPALERASGPGKTMVVPPVTAGEDFAFYQERIPGVFFFLGIAPKDGDPSKLAINHSPNFFVDESALVVGVRALSHVAVSYLEGEDKGKPQP